jgi:hypothetical protein
LSTCCSSSLISSYSSPSSLSSSVLLQRKSQGEMETGENNFLSQIQSFRQYIFAGSLSEYSEERKKIVIFNFPFNIWIYCLKVNKLCVFSNMIPRQHSTLTCVSPLHWRDKSKQNKKCKNITGQCHQSVTEQPSSCKCVFK